MEMNELTEPFSRMLDGVATSEAVRAIETGNSPTALWQNIANSGFIDALVAEEHGGAGLTFADAEPLIEALGARAVPLPIAETMVARSLLTECGVTPPDGPIVLATSLAKPVPCGLVAEHALVDTGQASILCKVSDLKPTSTGVPYSLAACFSGSSGGEALSLPKGTLRAIAAVVRSGLIAGAAARVCELTTTYASDRIQFGKPIGQQQALQQMLAVMAEDVIACRMAAQLAVTHGLHVPIEIAATAKITASLAAQRIADSAHAVHGAIGISEEYDLQLLTRRLHEWRLADGSEGYWSRLLGSSRLCHQGNTIGWAHNAIWLQQRVE